MTSAQYNNRKTSDKVRRFKEDLQSNDLTFLMEAHNGLSAKLVAEAGFAGIWASGFTIAASMGLRDCNEASWTQVTDVLELMTDATDIPILMDGDTGYGNFNNVRLLIKKLCRLDIAGVSIEDKVYPKTSSLVDREQLLIDIPTFCGKIKAGKDSQTNDDFSIVARTEALIAGLGVAEALKRAEAYHAAGADAILLHSKQTTADEVLTFAKEWANRLPLIIIPTVYYKTPTQQFRDAKIAMVIWANHALRAATSAMQAVLQQIKAEETLINIEDKICSVKEILTLTNDEELEAAEKRYQ